PSMRRSTIATRAPRSVALMAAAKAVEPEPRMTRSNGSGIGGPPSPLEGVVLAGRTDGRCEGRALDIRSGGDDRAAGREFDPGVFHAGDRLERLGDVGDAVVAGHPADAEIDIDDRVFIAHVAFPSVPWSILARATGNGR